jgi:hypothetical protein
MDRRWRRRCKSRGCAAAECWLVTARGGCAHEKGPREKGHRLTLGAVKGDQDEEEAMAVENSL